MTKIDTTAIRKEWASEADSELKRASLKMCDDYELAMKAIVVNKVQAEKLLRGELVEFKESMLYGNQV